jgi:taurine dioxygenase
VAAIQRHANENTSIFAEIFHSDWSFMAIPPAATALYGITIPPVGGETLFADQVAAYEHLPDDLRERVRGSHCDSFSCIGLCARWRLR